jgi:hypothetical protein
MSESKLVQATTDHAEAATRSPGRRMTAREAFEFWLQTPHRLEDPYDAPASAGDVFLRFMRMIDDAGWAFVPKEPTRNMTMRACDSLPSCEHVFGHAGKIAANVYRGMLDAAPKGE